MGRCGVNLEPRRVNPWREAFFIQAKSDFELFKDLSKKGYSHHHCLHLLQMTTEKMAKGFMCDRNDPISPPQTHYVFLKFIQKIAPANSALRELCRCKDSLIFKRYLTGLTPIAESIEDLVPRKSGDVNPEYPWEDTRGNIWCPVNYTFSGLELTTPKLAKMVSFLESCFILIEQEITE